MNKNVLFAITYAILIIMFVVVLLTRGIITKSWHEELVAHGCAHYEINATNGVSELVIGEWRITR